MTPQCTAVGHGAQIVVLPTRGTGAVVAIQLWITAGTAAEGAQEHGCAHLLEHMVFKPHRDGLDLAAQIEGVGGEINAFTSHDETVVHATVPVGVTQEAIDTMLDAVLRPRLDPEALAVESEVVVEEIRQYRDDPGSQATQALMEALYGRHPYARPVLGTIGQVRSHDAARLRRFHRRVYSGPRARLVVVGPVDPRAIVRWARPALAALPRGPVRDRSAVAPITEPLTQPRLRLRRSDVHEGHVQLAWRAPPVPESSACALEIASIVLGYGEASRLMQRVRRGQQLASDVVASFYPSRSGSALMISAHVPPAASHVAAVVRSIAAEVEELSAVPLTASELSRAKTVLRSDLVYRRETVTGHAHALGYNLSLGGSLSFDAAYYEALESIGAAEVRQQCARWLRPSAPALSVVVPNRVKLPPLRRTLVQYLRAASPRSKSRARSRARARSTVRHDRHGVASTTLPGGLRLLALVDRRVPMAAGWLLWPGGLRREDRRHNGASSMMARLVTRGCAAIEADALAQEIEGAAASLDGFSGRNSAGLHFECMAASVPTVLRRAVECALAPRFDPDELDEERRVVRQELSAEGDEPAKVAFRAAYERLYRAHPFAMRPRGTEASLDRMTSAGLRRLWSRWYPLGQAILAVAGDVDLDGLRGTLERLLADAPASTPLPAWPGRAPRYPRRPVELHRARAREQSHVVSAMPGLCLTDRSVPTLDVLMAVLGGQAGRLFVALREAEGLVYHVSASSSEGLDAGELTIYAATGPERLDRTRTVIDEQLRRLCTERVGADELARAKALLLGQHTIGMERLGRMASALAFNEAFGLPRHDHLRYPQRIEKVGAAAVQSLARSLLDPRRRVVAIVGP